MAIRVHEERLANGVRLLVVPREGALGVAAGWVVATGSVDDPADHPGLAHLLEHLLFQGTATVGVRDREREVELLAREEGIRERIRKEWSRRRAAGPGGGPFDPEAIAAELGLAETLEELRREQAAVALQGELALLYARAGAGELEARTFEDLSMFTVVLPPEALELWFWLESDRLLNPVFRQLHRELEVVREERRAELAGEPERRLEEALRRQLWGDHPYGRPVSGPPETLGLLSRAALHRSFAERFRPPGLTLALVGAVAPGEARGLAERYFGRLSARAAAPPDREVAPITTRTAAEWIRRVCPDRSRLQVLYPTSPFAGPDRPALELLAAVLNGRAGRLHRELVVTEELAWSAWAVHRPLVRGGELWIRFELRPGADPRRVLERWDRIVAGLRRKPVAEVELAGARNRSLTESLRGLREPRSLLGQLLVYDALGDWRVPLSLTGDLGAVDPERLREAARRYLGERRVVGVCAPAGGAR